VGKIEKTSQLRRESMLAKLLERLDNLEAETKLDPELFETARTILTKIYQECPTFPRPLLFAPNGTITFEWGNALLQVLGDCSCVFTWPEGEFETKVANDEFIHLITNAPLYSR
jgi:hypothetical protein